MYRNIIRVATIIDQGPIQNHKKQGVVKVYNLYKYEKEKKEALLAWEQKVIDLVEGRTGQVLEFKAAA